MGEITTIGIVGVGFVGNAVYHTFSPYYKIRLHDKYKPSFEPLEDVVNSNEFLFVCVPTPVNENGEQDLSCINDSINEIDKIANGSKIIILRSTILPGTTKTLAEKFQNHKFIFCPEFLTERTAIFDSINAYRIILGGDDKETLERTEELFRLRFPHTPIFQTNFECAELTKYVCNCFFSVKISFMNEIFEICQKLNLDYQEIRKLFLSDQRICNSHTEVPGPDGFLGFGGKCLYKDLNSLINFGCGQLNLEMDTMKSANKVNDRVREVKDWLTIKGATTENNYE